MASHSSTTARNSTKSSSSASRRGGHDERRGRLGETLRIRRPWRRLLLLLLLVHVLLVRGRVRPRERGRLLPERLEQRVDRRRLRDDAADRARGRPRRARERAQVLADDDVVEPSHRRDADVLRRRRRESGPEDRCRSSSRGGGRERRAAMARPTPAAPSPSRLRRRRADAPQVENRRRDRDATTRTPRRASTRVVHGAARVVGDAVAKNPRPSARAGHPSHRPRASGCEDDTPHAASLLLEFVRQITYGSITNSPRAPHARTRAPWPLPTATRWPSSSSLSPPAKPDDAIALFKDHEMGLKYTLSQKGAVDFDIGVQTAEVRRGRVVRPVVARPLTAPPSRVMIRYHPSIHPLTTDPTSPRAILSTLSVPSQDGSQTMYIYRALARGGGLRRVRRDARGQGAHEGVGRRVRAVRRGAADDQVVPEEVLRVQRRGDVE